MSADNIEKDYEYAAGKFKDFTGFLELRDFRTFLIYVMSEHSVVSFINKKLMGAGVQKFLNYDVLNKAYISEIGLVMGTTIFIYHKTDEVPEKHALGPTDRDFFDKYLSKAEQEILFESNKDKIFFIRYMNKKATVNKRYGLIPRVEVTNVYADLLSYILELVPPKEVMILDGNGDEPDILFDFTINISYPAAEHYIGLNVYIDREHRFRNATYLKFNPEELKFEGIDRIKEASHSELFRNRYILLMHIKSFDSIDI